MNNAQIRSRRNALATAGMGAVARSAPQEGDGAAKPALREGSGYAQPSAGKR